MHKNIIFDCGGVLHLWDPYELASVFTDNDNDKEIFVKDLFPKWHLLDLGMDNETFYNTIKNEFPERLHKNIYEIIYHWTDHFTVFKDMIDIVNSLKDEHNLYLLSNMPHSFAEIAKKSEEFKVFDELFFSCDYGLVKPDTKFFKILLDKHNLNPKDCLFIDDVETNLLGAKKLSIDTYLFDINKIDEFKDYIDKYERTNIK